MVVIVATGSFKEEEDNFQTDIRRKRNDGILDLLERISVAFRQELLSQFAAISKCKPVMMPSNWKAESSFQKPNGICLVREPNGTVKRLRNVEKKSSTHWLVGNLW